MSTPNWKKATEYQKKNLSKGMIKKGEVRNPLGGAAHNPHIKALKHLTQKEYADVIQLALDNNRAGIEKIIQDKSTSLLKLGIAKCLLNAVNQSDFSILHAIIEKIIGKPTQKIELTQKRDLSMYSDEDLEALKKIMIKYEQSNDS